jgi:hypothetical protein
VIFKNKILKIKGESTYQKPFNSYPYLKKMVAKTLPLLNDVIANKDLGSSAAKKSRESDRRRWRKQKKNNKPDQFLDAGDDEGARGYYRRRSTPATSRSAATPGRHYLLHCR